MTSARRTSSRRIRDAYGAIPCVRDPRRRHAARAAAARRARGRAQEADAEREDRSSATTARRSATSITRPASILNEVLFGGRARRAATASSSRSARACTECAAGSSTFRDPGPLRDLLHRASGHRPATSPRGARSRARAGARPSWSTERRARAREGAARARPAAVARDGQRQGRADRLLRHRARRSRRGVLAARSATDASRVRSSCDRGAALLRRRARTIIRRASRSPRKRARLEPEASAYVGFDLDGGAIGYVESSTRCRRSFRSSSPLRSGAIADPDGKDGVCRASPRACCGAAAEGMPSHEIEARIDASAAELSARRRSVERHRLHVRSSGATLEPFVELLAR